MEKDQKEEVIIRVNNSFELGLNKFSFFIDFDLTSDWVLSEPLIIQTYNNEDFSQTMQATYWYLKYHLLKDGRVEIDFEDFAVICNENDIFFDTISITSKSLNRKLLKVDGGDWLIEILKSDLTLKKQILDNFDQN